jgi:pyruvate kinase
MRNAKVVCTLGPASDDEATVAALADAGMAVARLNASHGDREGRRAVLETVRAVDRRREEPVATMLDLQGPEIRTAPAETPVDLAAGSTVRFVESEETTPDAVGVSTVLTAVEPGDRVLLDDGHVETTVTGVDGDAVTARVETGGPVPGRSGVNVPGVELDLPVPTDADREEIRLAVEAGVDFVAASFVRDADDVYRVEEAVEAAGGDVPVVAKIERELAVDNVAAIVDAAFGVMVARGDLGVECPLEEVPMIQKRVIRRCRETGTPVITATEMLDSMVEARRPTRAEASDVANAVLDGTDAVMLSGETAVGEHPVAVVEAMDRIVRQVEASEEYAELREQRVPTADEGRTEALARSARYLARDVGATAVVAASESGYTVRKTAKFRPGVPLVAAVRDDAIRRQLALVSGVVARRVDYPAGGPGDVIEAAAGAALDAGVADSGDAVVVLSGMMTDMDGSDTANTLKVHVAAETLTTGRGVVTGRATGPVARTPDGDLSPVPDGAVLALPADFDGEFAGDQERLAAIVSGAGGTTGYAALVAREAGLPMVSAAELGPLADGATVTVDGERGVVYGGRVDAPGQGNV